MKLSYKFSQLFSGSRDEKEIQRWIFSLIPLGVVLSFFFVFLLPMDVPNKSVFMVMGLAAGFAGLQSYWVFRGWQRNEGMTVVLGVLGIAITFGLLWLYLSFQSFA